MNRFDIVRRAIGDAYRNKTLAASNYRTCAIAHILKAFGIENLDSWHAALAAYKFGYDPFALTLFEAMTGFSADELIALEEAFEMDKLDPLKRRVSMSQDVSLEDRIHSFLDQLESIEKKCVVF